jgi:DUF4097 and DUF4098 domain-containing protein YvlB
MVAFTLLTGLLTAVAVQQTDTVVSVDPGARLVIENFRGEVTINTWDRNEMRVVGDHSSRTYVDVVQSRSAVRLRADAYAGPAQVDYELTVPISMDIDIRGTFVNADIDGSEGEVRVFTTQGDIDVRGGRGFIQLETVNGRVNLEEADGNIEVQSTNGRVTVTGASGEIAATSVNGRVTLQGIESSDVRAETTSGGVYFDGTIVDGGRYTLNTHSGDVVVAMQEGVNATFGVSTFSGNLDTAFPVTVTGTRAPGRPFSFTLGDGSARVELRSFSGDIELTRRDASRRP